MYHNPWTVSNILHLNDHICLVVKEYTIYCMLNTPKCLSFTYEHKLKRLYPGTTAWVRMSISK